MLTQWLSAQYISIVCSGEEGVVYRVQGNPGSTFDWNVQGGSISENYGDSIKVDWGNSPGEYDLRVQEFSKFGCAALPVSGKVLVSGPVVDLGNDQDICEGAVIELLPVGTFESYTWSDGSTAPNYIGRNQGKISLTVTDQYGCVGYDEMFLAVHSLPQINLGTDTSLCGNESLTLDAGNPGATYLWSGGQTDREITVYEGHQDISVSVTDDYGCSSTDEIVINDCTSLDLFKNMASAFTPNNDGKNDVWEIPQLSTFPRAVVEVYDRWGTLVFRSEPGYPKPWDGLSAGKDVPMDSYYFIISLNRAGLESLSGTVTLIK
jgi:gliding motility-associated-like protein